MSEARITEWEGGGEGYSWKVEVETDLFTSEEGFVVVIDVGGVDEDGKHEALATTSSSQAREIAAALIFAADNVDFNNARAEVQELIEEP